MVVLFVPRYRWYYHCSPDLDAHSQVRSMSRNFLYKKTLHRLQTPTFQFGCSVLVCSTIQAFEPSLPTHNHRHAILPSILTNHTRNTVQVSMAFLQFWFLNSLPRYLPSTNDLLHVFQLLDEPKAPSFGAGDVLVCSNWLNVNNERLPKFRD